MKEGRYIFKCNTNRSEERKRNLSRAVQQRGSMEWGKKQAAYASIKSETKMSTAATSTCVCLRVGVRKIPGIKSCSIKVALLDRKGK